MKSHENRNMPRIQTRLPGVVHSSRRESASQDAVISNMSMRGAFIETCSAFNIGDMIRFEMLFPRKNMAACLYGVVRWCSDATPQVVGVEVVKVC